MAHPLEALLVLQEKDRKRLRLTREISDIPARRAEVEQQLEGARGRLEASRNELVEHTAALKQLEVEADARRDKIVKYKQQQMEARTNEQYRALLNEVAAEERGINALEDQELVLMEQIEACKKQIADREEELRTEEEAIAEELEMLTERMQEAREEIQELNIRRQKLAADVSPGLLKHYERIFANKGDFAVVDVENGHCAGCRMKLPPQVVNDSINPAKLISCNFCGRLLINRR